MSILNDLDCAVHQAKETPSIPIDEFLKVISDIWIDGPGVISEMYSFTATDGQMTSNSSWLGWMYIGNSRKQLLKKIIREWRIDSHIVGY